MRQDNRWADKRIVATQIWYHYASNANPFIFFKNLLEIVIKRANLSVFMSILHVRNECVCTDAIL